MMRFYLGIHILLTIVVIKVSCDCGIVAPHANSSDTFEDGIDASIFPWHVWIYEEFGDDLEFACPGTLVSPDVVITAASCLNRTEEEIDIAEFYVVTGNNTPRFGLKTRIQKSKIRTYYRTIRYPASQIKTSGDLAWLVLQHPLNLTSSLRPVCIDLEDRPNREDLSLGLVGQIVYRTDLLNQTLPKLRKMEIIPSHSEACYHVYQDDRRRNKWINPSCARISNHIGATHDIVGSGFYTQHNGRWYIRGIITMVFVYEFANKKDYQIHALIVPVEHDADVIIIKEIIKKCGIATAPVNPLATRDLQTELGRYPWRVVVYRTNSTGYYDQTCAGSLISTRVVISAAHCFYDDVNRQKHPASSFTVVAGKFYRLYDMPERFVQKSAVQTIHLSSGYLGSAGNYANDIAWLILQHPFFISTFVMPICMDLNNSHQSEDLQAGQLGQVVGWAKTAAGVISNELQENQVPFIPRDECIPACPQEFTPVITSDKFCAGYLNGTTLCVGDSGGGLAFPHSGIWYLRGIFSLSPSSGIDTCLNSYMAFTDIGNFIDEHHRIVNMSTHEINLD